MNIAPFMFIFNYFAAKNIFLIKTYVCWDSGFILQWQKAGLALGLRTSVIKAPSWSDKRPRQRHGVFLDLVCPFSAEVLSQASASRALDFRHSWLILGVSNSSEMWNALQEAKVQLDSDLMLWTPRDQFFDIYKIKDGLPWKTTTMALSKDCEVDELRTTLNTMPSMVARRKDLEGIYIRGAIVVPRPDLFRGWDDRLNRQIDFVPKVTYPLKVLVAEDLNFRWNMRQVDNYGKLVNGTHTGLVGLLQRGLIEVAGNSLFMRKDRMPVLQYVFETYELRNPFFFLQPPQGLVSNVFVLPLSRGSWIASGVTLAGAAVMLVMLGRLPMTRILDPEVKTLHVDEAILFMLAAVSQQGWIEPPRLWSVRLIMVSAWLATLFVFTAYSAKVVSILQSPSSSIRTMADLARSPMAIGDQEVTYKGIYLRENPDPVVREMYWRKVAPLGDRAFFDPEEGMRKVRRGLFAFQIERPVGYDLIHKEWDEGAKCLLTEIEAFRTPTLAWPIARDAPYTELLAVRFRWIRENGLMDRWKMIWVPQKPRCSGGGGGFASVGLVETSPALYVMLAGLATAMALLMAELLYHRLKR